MGEYDFTNNLTTLSRFRTPTEAALAKNQLEVEGIEAHLEGTHTATSLGHLGPDLVGASLLVRQGDLRRAREILAHLLPTEGEEDTDDEDWSGEDWADDDYYDEDDDDYEPYSEEPVETPPLTRAWRASVIGTFFLPTTIYSIWLIVQHQLWRPQPGETSVNWRFPAAMLLNLVGVVFFCFLWVFVR